MSHNFSNLLSPFSAMFKRQPSRNGPSRPGFATPFPRAQNPQATPFPRSPLTPPPQTSGRPINPLGVGVQGPLLPGQQRAQGPTPAPVAPFSPTQAVPQVLPQGAVPQALPPTPAPVAPTTAQQFTTPSGAVVDAQGNIISQPEQQAGTPAQPAQAQQQAPVPPDIQAAEQAIADAQKIGPEALSTQADLDRLLEQAGKLQTSFDLGFQKIEEKPIELGVLRGQQANLRNRAIGEIEALARQSEPLERKLSRLQAQRQASLESSRFALTRADRRADIARQSAFRREDITRESAQARRAETESARRFGISSGRQQEAQDLARDKFNEGVRQFGLQFAQTQQRLDEADSKAEDTGNNADVVDALQLKIDFIDEISTHAGLNSRVGPTGFARKTFAISDRFGAGQDFAGSVRQLASQEFLDKLINVKAQGATFGALTDREGDALRAAATKINDWEIKDENGLGIGEWDIDEKSFKRELTKIQTLAKKTLERAGGTATGNFVTAPDGTLVEIID